ncbi:hypothetical protein V1517DRAFT_360083 [Lipomyces orientalis]|uniref:Uncharacterized protein n=1 Tax=Lipomyces orientalis TaxID=1233043 RepID=A0ACC3TYE8_9ASCO
MKYGRNSFRNGLALFTNLSHMRDRQPFEIAGQMSGHKNEMSNYAEALHLLKDNSPEQRLDVRLPYSMYLDLQKSWSSLKRRWTFARIRIRRCRYPRLSYNSLDEIATVVPIQRTLYEVADYHSPPQEAGRIVPTGFMTEMGTYGKYAKSLKEPDGSFFYDDNNAGYVLRVVIEAGHSEYRRLLRDKDMWMKDMNAKAVVLICFKESPRFQNPHTVYEDIEDVNLEVARMTQHIGKVQNRNIENGFYFYGSVEYTDAFIEVWRAGTKDPVRSLNSDIYFDPYRYLRSPMNATVITAQYRYHDFIFERQH